MMGMDLSNINLLSLQTSFMRQDPTTQALCAALEPQFRKLADEVKACLIYAKVDELDNTALDELACEMHVDFYDANASLEQKRDLIKKSLIIHETKGTPYAVETLISALFGEGYVEEWFEYGGDPYTFRVLTNNAAVTNEKAQEFIKALNSVKNARSWLDSVIITLNEDLPLYFAGIVHTGDFITIKEG